MGNSVYSDCRCTDLLCDWRQLCSALRVNGTVTKLNLNSNAISDQGIKYLASMLTDEKVDSLYCIHFHVEFRVARLPNLLASLMNDGRFPQCRICKLAMWCDGKLGDQGAQYLANALKVPLKTTA